jgi:hypothetical protein
MRDAFVWRKGRLVAFFPRVTEQQLKNIGDAFGDLAYVISTKEEVVN